MKNLTWICAAMLCMHINVFGQSDDCPVVFDNLDIDQIAVMDPFQSSETTYGVYQFYISEPTVLSQLDLAIWQIPHNGWEGEGGYYGGGGGGEGEGEGEGEYSMPSSIGNLYYASIGIAGPHATIGYSFSNIPVHASGGYVSVHRMDLTGSPVTQSYGEVIPGQGIKLLPGNYSLYVSVYHSTYDYMNATYVTGNFDLYGCPADNGDRDGDGIPNEEDNCPDLVDTEAPQITASLDMHGGQDGNKANFVVNYSGTDNCDGEIVVDAMIDLPDTEGFDVEFKTKSKIAISVDTRKNKVRVEAPDPQSFWTAAIEKGGFTVAAGHIFEFKQKNDSKAFTEYKFDGDGQLSHVKGPECMLQCSATDQAGNTGMAKGAAALAEDLVDAISEKHKTPVSEMSFESVGMTIYPNPASDVLQINIPLSDQDVHLVIIDQAGKKRWERNIRPNTIQTLTMELSDFPNGVYFLQARHTDKSEIKRLIISK